jgi:hypothetical protein
MTYSLTLSDDSPITNSALTFDASTPSMSVYSTDNSQAELMTAKLTATSDDDASIAASSEFQVEIFELPYNLYAPVFLTELQGEVEVTVN